MISSIVTSIANVVVVVISICYLLQFLSIYELVGIRDNSWDEIVVVEAKWVTMVNVMIVKGYECIIINEGFIIINRYYIKVIK